jgi:hypothetical protein
MFFYLKSPYYTPLHPSQEGNRTGPHFLESLPNTSGVVTIDVREIIFITGQKQRVPLLRGAGVCQVDLFVMFFY